MRCEDNSRSPLGKTTRKATARALGLANCRSSHPSQKREGWGTPVGLCPVKENRQQQQQIPFGDDNQKGNCKDKCCCCDALKVASEGLFSFDGFEEGFEVALAEAAAALALDDLVEDGGAVLDGAGEDLEHVAFVIAVDEDAEFFELFDGLVDLADAGLQLGVVGVGDGEEVDSLPAHRGDGGENVVRGDCHVLDSGSAVEVE